MQWPHKYFSYAFMRLMPLASTRGISRHHCSFGRRTLCTSPSSRSESHTTRLSRLRFAGDILEHHNPSRGSSSESSWSCSSLMIMIIIIMRRSRDHWHPPAIDVPESRVATPTLLDSNLQVRCQEALRRLAQACQWIDWSEEAWCSFPFVCTISSLSELRLSS